jgi:energy-coupling factor transport system substrate-specific component
VSPPFIFLGLLPVLVLVARVELTEGGMDSKALAALAVLATLRRASRRATYDERAEVAAAG